MKIKLSTALILVSIYSLVWSAVTVSIKNEYILISNQKDVQHQLLVERYDSALRKLIADCKDNYEIVIDNITYKCYLISKVQIMAQTQQRRRQVYEIFEEFSEAKNKEARLAVLEKYTRVGAFKDILRGTFDDNLVFNLPEGRPPYTPNKPESVPSTLLMLHKRFGLFVLGGDGDKLPAYRRENIFVQTLESIHPKDAELVINMTNKTPPIKFLTKKLVQEAYPSLIKS